MKHSEQINELATALAKAQGAIKGASKDRDNTFFKSKYATLASHVEAIREAFSTNGLSYAQFVITQDNAVGIETMLMHASGQWLLGDPFFVPVTKADAQGFGSAMTYCRRYSLSAAAGTAPDDATDDDGNAATTAAPKPKERPNTATQVAVDAFDEMSDEHKDYLSTHAREIQRLFELKKDMLTYVEKQRFDTQDSLALWSLLPSALRSEYKRQQAADREASAKAKQQKVFTPAELGSQP